MAVEDAAFWDRRVELTEKVWMLPEGLRRALRGQQMDQMRRFLLKPGGRLLELGCGSGLLSREFARAGMQVTGVDISPASLERASREARREGLENAEFRRVDLRSFQPEELEQGSYDSILSYAVLYWLQDDLEEILGKLAGLLKEGGRLYLYEPVGYRGRGLLRGLYRYPFTALRLAVFGSGFLLDRNGREVKAARAVERSQPHTRAFQPGALEALLGRHFQVADVQHWHMASEAFAEMCAVLRQPARALLTPLVGPLYRLERRVLASRFMRTGQRGWVMTSYSCVKSG